MRNYRLLLALGLLVVFSSGSYAQDSGLFSGQGVRFPESKPAPKKSKWPKLLTFPKSDVPQTSSRGFGETAEKKPIFQLPSFTKPSMPKTGWEKPSFPKPDFSKFSLNKDTFESDSDSDSFRFPAVLPKRDPDQPSMLSQMNEKSKDFFDRTTGWTQRKNKRMREKSATTWDAITKDMRALQPKSTNEMIPAQPPVRTAESPDKPRVRF